MKRFQFPFVAAVALCLTMSSGSAIAMTINVPGDQPDIQSAINVASPGDLILVAPGTYVIGTTINVTVASLTIQGSGSGSTTLQVASAVGNAFYIPSANTTLRDFTIEKTDLPGAPHELVWINANGVTVRDNVIFGPDPGTPWSVNGIVSRAMVVSPGLSGLLIENNTIHHLRQPAYIDAGPGLVGSIINNHVSGTRGWVVAGAKLNFSGNTWGPPQNQGAEIALLSTCVPADYPDLLALSNTNGNAYISDQFSGGPSGRATAYVDDSAAPGGFGSALAPYLTVGDGVANTLAGGTVQVAAGLYTEQVHVNGKNLTIQGAGKAFTTIQSPITLTLSFSTGPNNFPIVFIENALDVRVRDLTIDGAGRGNANYRFQGIAWWNAGGKLLDSDVKDIRETPLSGTQHGVAVYANYNTGGPYSLEIGNASLTGFQKNGTVFVGSALTVNMHDCTVTGAGSTTLLAQNGVQFTSGTSGTVTNCAVSNSFYSPGGTTSTGLLMFQAGTVNVSGSNLTNCQSAAYYLETNGSIAGTSISGALGWFGVIHENDQASLHNGAGGGPSLRHPSVSAMDVDAAPSTVGTNSVAATMFTLSISNGCMIGPGTVNTYGVDVYSAGGGVSCTMTNMEVTNWGYGVLVENPGATMSANHNAIVANLTAGYDGTTGAGSQLAELNWWGNAGGPGVGGANTALGVDSTPWLISGNDTTPGCGFTPGPDNVVTPGPAPSCISIANPCITIPVSISRTTADQVRGFSVNVQLSANLLLCSGPSSITEGSYLLTSNFGTVTNFQVIDNGGGSYTVDGAILGTPCGATAVTGNLFNVAVKKAPGPDGTGTVTLSSLLLRDCSNVPVAASTGAPLSITIDTATPGAITDLAAAQVLSGNGAVSTTGISLTWATGGAGTVKLYRAPFGVYPEYDDDGPVSPPSPAAAPGAPWALVTASATSPYVDAAAARGFWYYVAFITDACGNVSTVSNMTGGTLNYLLGDVTPAPGSGDNKVDGLDISLLGFNYGLTGEIPVDAVGYLDVGPTLTGAANARPTPDDKLNFEDLIIYAINYGPTGLQKATPLAGRLGGGTPSVTDVLSLEAPSRVQPGETFAVSLRLKGAGDLQGISTQLRWDPAIAEPARVDAGSWLESLNGLALSAAPGNVDVALLGAGQGFSGDGVLATVTFRALASGDPKVAIARADARDASNRKIDLSSQRPVVPTTTEFGPAAPNPFNRMTNLSFSLARSGDVDLAIYSVDGRRVKTLARGLHEASIYRLVWDGTDDGGHVVGTGLYFARLITPVGQFTRRLMMVK